MLQHSHIQQIHPPYSHLQHHIQATSQFSSKHREETHFMDPKLHLNHFSSTKDKSALKVKVPTSIKIGTTCCFEMTVFPPSTRHGSSPSLVLLMGSWHPTNLPLIGKSSTGAPNNLKCDAQVYFRLPRDKYALPILQGSFYDTKIYS